MPKKFLFALTVSFFLAAFIAGAALGQETTPQAIESITDDQVNAVAKQLYCPVCENIPLDVCPTQACAEWRELMRDGETGVLFAPDDPAACADALADLLDRRGDWEAIRATARGHVAAAHDWARNSQRYQAVYHQMLGQSGTGRIPG